MKMEQVPPPQRAGKSKKGARTAAPATLAASAAGPAPAPASPDADTPWILRAWARLRREPSMLVTVVYLLVSAIGLWANFWFYRGFGVPILEYMQPSDYLVAGLRDPAYALLLLASVVISVLVSWPDSLARRQPARVAVLRRTWWGRQVFPESRWLSWRLFGITPETGMAVVVVCGMLWTSANYVQVRGQAIREGRDGALVRVLRADANVPAREARLLGSSGMFVFVWWPDTRVPEVLPIEAVGGLQSVAASAATPVPAPVASGAIARPAGDLVPTVSPRVPTAPAPEKPAQRHSTRANAAP